MSDDRHEAVSRRAYELWEKEGGAHGRHEDHWHQAASEVAGNPAAPDGTTMDSAGPADAATDVAPAVKTGAKTAARATTAPAAKPRKPKTTK